MAYKAPPVNVRLALEPVVALISDRAVKCEWTEIKEWLRKDDFIQRVMNYNINTLSPKVKAFIRKNYLDNKAEFDIEKIKKASKAAGPLGMWVQSLLDYADIFDSITPLRNEVS